MEVPSFLAMVTNLCAKRDRQELLQTNDNCQLQTIDIN